MLAAAYAVADGGPITLSPELSLAREINRFGVQAVMGRPLSYNEILKLRAAERVINAYKSKTAAGDWAKWATDFPADDAFLNLALQLAEKYGWC